MKIPMSFCCYGNSNVNKTYSKIKFNVRGVVSFSGFFMQKFFHIEHRAANKFFILEGLMSYCMAGQN